MTRNEWIRVAQEELVPIADQLDEEGNFELADEVDSMIVRIAQATGGMTKEAWNWGAAGMGAGAGAATGALLGTASGPLAPVGVPAGALIGAGIGAIGGGLAQNPAEGNSSGVSSMGTPAEMTVMQWMSTQPSWTIDVFKQFNQVDTDPKKAQIQYQNWLLGAAKEYIQKNPKAADWVPGAKPTATDPSGATTPASPQNRDQVDTQIQQTRGTLINLMKQKVQYLPAAKAQGYISLIQHLEQAQRYGEDVISSEQSPSGVISYD